MILNFEFKRKHVRICLDQPKRLIFQMSYRGIPPCSGGRARLVDHNGLGMRVASVTFRLNLNIYFKLSEN